MQQCQKYRYWYYSIIDYVIARVADYAFIIRLSNTHCYVYTCTHDAMTSNYIQQDTMTPPPPQCMYMCIYVYIYTCTIVHCVPHLRSYGSTVGSHPVVKYSSSASSNSISSSAIVVMNTFSWPFSTMRLVRTLLGMTIIPFCRHQRIRS